MALRKIAPSTKGSANKGRLWSNTKTLLNSSRVIPFIGRYFSQQIFGGEKIVASTLANDETVQAPFQEHEKCDLARIAQYLSFQKDNDRQTVKDQYLRDLKGFLLGKAMDKGEEEEVINGFAQRLDALNYSMLANDLKFPRFENPNQNPLRQLAELPLTIYVTTCHHKFLEAELSQTGNKVPETEIFYWDDSLHELPSVFDKDPNYIPSVKRPLVYHLYGVDSDPESLVLTEDDYLDCLARLAMLSQETTLSNNHRKIPAVIKRALNSRSLLMLGYDIHSWEFRVLFHSFILANRGGGSNRQLPKSISIQLKPKSNTGQTIESGVPQEIDPELQVEIQEESARLERIEKFLNTFFEKSEFDVYWGSVEKCVKELWEIYRK